MVNYGEYDVIVAGGGVAGIAAALSSARNGARTALIEKQCMLGGLGTAGLITVYLPLCDGRGNQMIFGIGEELLRLSIKHGHEDRYPLPLAWLDSGNHEERINKRFQVQYNPQMFAMIAAELLLSEGVNIIYDTMVTDVITKDNKITSIIVNNRQGQGAMSAKTFVDATGDAVLCHLSGEDCETFYENRFAVWYYHSTAEGYKLHPNSGNYVNPPEGEPAYDGVNFEDVNEMIIRGHQEILKSVLKKREETGNPNIMPVTIPTMPSFRMTRRLSGAYTLDESEEGRDFDDTIGKTGDWRKRGPVFSIPYRCLYGKKIDNLLTAGRCISVTTPMWDITRVIPTCALTGEAAGVAAAVAAVQGSVSQIDIKALQKKLPIA